MQHHKNNSGFTIVESMIFLVISGLILVTTLMFFNGKQDRVQFNQGAVEIESHIKTVMNEVSSGYYPKKGDFVCSEGVNGPVLDFDSTEEQGANENCIFLGDVLSFYAEGDKAYAVIGLRKSQDLAEAKPTINDELVQSYNMPWGIRVTKVVSVNDGTQTSIKSVGLISSLGNYSTDGAGQVSISSGSQAIDLVPLGSGISDSDDQVIASVVGMVDADRRPDKVIVCLESAGGDRKATIVLGGEGKQLNTELIIDTNFSECNDE